MKKILRFFATLLLLIGFWQQGYGQLGLKVDSLYHFPQLPDTAYQNTSYDSIQIRLHNYGNSTFTGVVPVFMKSDTLPGFLHVDTLRSDTTTILILPPGGDTLIQARTNIFLQPANYAAGDNIVVVWPALRTVFPVDSYYVHIYYTLVSGIDDPSMEGQIVLSPVPSRHLLRFTYTHIESIEQVRIYDTKGRLVKDSPIPLETLDVTSYPSGVYYVAILRKDGSRVVKKILVL